MCVNMAIVKTFFRVKILLYSIYFNFRILPFKQAVHFPFCCCVWPTIYNKGKVLFECEKIRPFMIKLGVQKLPIYTQKCLAWKNYGTINFKGKTTIGHHCMINIHKDGYLEFGNQVGVNSGSRIVCQKKVVFGEKVRISWDCQIFDTNFHPLIDMVSEKPLKMCTPIIIGDNCWIGHNVIISKGVKLAEGTIVSSGSVVKQSHKEPHCIISGNPAIKIGSGYRASFYDF